ncbi:MAG: elongation factor 1-alpha C-terminal domain-related protein [Pseudonocardiaceae bacterium]
MPRATAGRSVTVLLTDDLDVGRDEVLARPQQAPQAIIELDADLRWLTDQPLRTGARVLVKHCTRTVRAIVAALTGRLNLHTLRHTAPPAALELNEIGSTRIRLAQPLAVDFSPPTATPAAFSASTPPKAHPRRRPGRVCTQPEASGGGARHPRPTPPPPQSRRPVPGVAPGSCIKSPRSRRREVARPVSGTS